MSQLKTTSLKLSIEVTATAGFEVIEVPHPTMPGIIVWVDLVAHKREDGIVIEVERAILVEEATGKVLDAPYKGLIMFSGYAPNAKGVHV